MLENPFFRFASSSVIYLGLQSLGSWLGVADRVGDGSSAVPAPQLADFHYALSLEQNLGPYFPHLLHLLLSEEVIEQW